MSNKLKDIIRSNAEQILGMGKIVVKFSQPTIEEDTYTELHKSSKLNSTNFTNCCGCAVTDRDTRCPECKALIYGRQF